jgi:hypothetical protein
MRGHLNCGIGFSIEVNMPYNMPCWIFLAVVMEADMRYYGSEKE